jgi:hypothetical protein
MLRRIALLLSVVTLLSAAAPPPKPLAPDAIPHPMALYLAQLSADGKKSVTFKATAVGTRFFLEEPAGVTVYAYDGSGYRKTEFLKGFTLAKALKKYGVK